MKGPHPLHGLSPKRQRPSPQTWRGGILSLALFLCASPLFADRVLLKNGTFDTGKVEADTPEYVILSGKDDSLKRIKRSDIEAVTYDSGAKNSSAPGRPAQGSPGLTLFNLLTFRNFTGAVTLGWENLSLSNLNDTLTPKGYKAVPENNFALGGTAQVSISRIVLGLEGAWLWGAGRESMVAGNTIKNSFSAFKAIGLIGFLFYTSERLDIFPYVGFGLAGYNLVMTNAQNDTFSNIVSTGQRGAVLSSASLLMSTGAQLTYRVPVLVADKGVFGLALGIKGGYDIAFVNSDWVSGGINDLIPVSGGPKTSLTGPYAQALIGIWFDFF